MKKQLLSILTAGCLMAAMVPAAFAADANDLQAQIDAAEAGSTIKLNENTTITTPLNINKSITLDGNGYTLTYTGTGYAIQLNTNDAVAFDDLDLDATSSGGRGLEIVSNKPNFKLNDSLWNVNNRGIGFGSNGTVAGATVTIDSSIIQDSKKPENKTYENWSDQADTRGISLWNNKGLELNIIDNSAILGFGYPINMAGDIVDGVRDMADSVINITNSNIWGWCAMNIWTIDTTFNIKNSNLKGFVETDNAWNSFATIASHPAEQIRVDLPSPGNHCSEVALYRGPFTSEVVGGFPIDFLCDLFQPILFHDGKMNGINCEGKSLVTPGDPKGAQRFQNGCHRHILLNEKI